MSTQFEQSLGKLIRWSKGRDNTTRLDNLDTTSPTFADLRIVLSSVLVTGLNKQAVSKPDYSFWGVFEPDPPQPCRHRNIVRVSIPNVTDWSVATSSQWRCKDCGAAGPWAARPTISR